MDPRRAVPLDTCEKKKRKIFQASVYCLVEGTQNVQKLYPRHLNASYRTMPKKKDKSTSFLRASLHQIDEKLNSTFEKRFEKFQT